MANVSDISDGGYKLLILEENRKKSLNRKKTVDISRNLWYSSKVVTRETSCPTEK